MPTIADMLNNNFIVYIRVMEAFRCEPKNAFEVVKKLTNECQQIFLTGFFMLT